MSQPPPTPPRRDAPSDRPSPGTPLPLDCETPATRQGSQSAYTRAEMAFIGCGLLTAIVIVGGVYIGNDALNEVLLPLATILSCGALVGFVLGLIQRRRPRHAGWLLGGLAAAILPSTYVVHVLLPYRAVSIRETAPRVMCSSNLRQIRLAITLYANANNGACPDGMADLLVTTGIGSDVMVCPATAMVKAPGRTPQEVADNFAQGPHLSYVYVAKGLLLAGIPPDGIIAYEPLANHSGEGMNVLYGDGHVSWANKTLARKILDELASGHNPPRAEKLK